MPSLIIPLPIFYTLMYGFVLLGIAAMDVFVSCLTMTSLFSFDERLILYCCVAPVISAIITAVAAILDYTKERWRMQNDFSIPVRGRVYRIEIIEEKKKKARKDI